MNDPSVLLSSLDWEFYKRIRFKNNQVLLFSYLDENPRNLVFQPHINFLIKYFKISFYTEIGIVSGLNFLTTCQYIEQLNLKCSAQGISLFNFPIERMNKLKNDDLIVSKNLEKDNIYSFATISNASIKDKIIKFWDHEQSQLTVLNQISGFTVEHINEYYKTARSNSILFISKFIFKKDAQKALDFVKSQQFKFLETKHAIIIFKEFEDSRLNAFLNEFDSVYKLPLEFFGYCLINRAKHHQVSARNNDIFNLKLVKAEKDKHFFSVVGFFRNESMVLKEWIEHYIKFGADHFYLVDNNSNDNYYEILKPYIDRGMVTLYFCSEEKYQLGMLRELTNILKNETIWAGAFDLDEFIYPPYSKLITDVIRKYETFDAIVIPWLVFGSNHHIKQPESIVAGFTKRMKYDGNYSITKSIVKTSTIKVFTQHVAWTKNESHVMADGKTVQGRPSRIKLYESDIPVYELLNNHYAVQSLDYFEQVKFHRPEVAENCTSTKSYVYFIETDLIANEIVDEKLALKK